MLHKLVGFGLREFLLKQWDYSPPFSMSDIHLGCALLISLIEDFGWDRSKASCKKLNQPIRAPKSTKRNPYFHCPITIALDVLRRQRCHATFLAWCFNFPVRLNTWNIFDTHERDFFKIFFSKVFRLVFSSPSQVVKRSLILKAKFKRVL